MAVDTSKPIAVGDHVYWTMGGHAEAGYEAQVLAVYPQDEVDYLGIRKPGLACDIRWWSKIAGGWRIARGVPRRRLFHIPPAFVAHKAVKPAPKPGPERLSAEERRLKRLQAEQRAREKVGRPDIRIDPAVKPKRQRKPKPGAPASASVDVGRMDLAQLAAALTPAQLAALAELAKQREAYKPAPPPADDDQPERCPDCGAPVEETADEAACACHAPVHCAHCDRELADGGDCDCPGWRAAASDAA